ncbi:MAG: GrpB family protein [Bacteroidia bacterium]|nr:GrpB family protein [Bacteroidia bacterium]
MNEDLDKLSIDELGKLFPIKISGYNPDWKNRFVSEKQIIRKTIGTKNIIRIEHIGSTAVPGLCAKPTIDILVEIKNETNSALIINDLARIGYHFISKPENPPPHMMFVKGYSKKGYIGQTFHIHVRYGGDWDELIFRDYLIQNPKIAQEYAELKLRLSTDYINDREEYTNSKTAFITQITKTAREELKT